ncbi:substrate-binding protein [Endozoicomonas sp. SM1973]|uniref:Substrate-binding protein n=1 Tax=Spartinivicinus marinus TaxID=2994442 RepID=A0A853IIZ6_9GAMM|nr:substrate-binding protein [Spartinivicinus marinus]MCX4027804.1 substrate-binding protein [Spartinivicinus marinus]NYZ69055.1 substrate-binding protein [Spartinivicinus marinus]
MHTIKRVNFAIPFLLVLGVIKAGLAYSDTVKLGLNYPKTGPYSVQGLDQWRAAEMAKDEINQMGGILGKQVEIIWRDSKSKAKQATKNVRELIDDEGVQMIFGGSSSGVAIAAGKVCKVSKIPCFGTLTYSTATTGESGHRYMFRECYNAWPGAKVLAAYMNKNFSGKKYFYITADYTWGHTTEASFRIFTNTQDKNVHASIKTPFPTATKSNFKLAIKYAKAKSPDVLVLVLFGKDMAMALKEATSQGLKENTQIVVPNLTLGMAESAGAEAMEGVLGALPWSWRIPELTGSEKGKAFVKKFTEKYNRYPSTSGASAYTIMYEYKAAVEKSGSFDPAKVILALEGRKYKLLKDEQYWRDFDHQSIQTVYAVRGKTIAEVNADPYKLDYFEIIDQMSGDKAFRTREEWERVRREANMPTYLEPKEL